MPHIMGIKIHYDHRTSIAPHLKYSTLPTAEEYNEFVSLFRDEGKGGNGFHECLNFAVREAQPVRIYIPPTCFPAKAKMDDDFLLFSFNYRGTDTFPPSIIGVHGGVKFLSVKPGGIPRPDHHSIEGVDVPLHFHAEAPSYLSTLLVPAIDYDFKDGIYTPKYRNWGYGNRYMLPEHAAAIIGQAMQNAESALASAEIPKREALTRQLDVLERINLRYSLDVKPSRGSKRTDPKSKTAGLPDSEIGYLGERFIYDREIETAKRLKIDPSRVEWISQSVPASPFDIKTVRRSGEREYDHYIEVKSTGGDELNVYVSSGQCDFFRTRNDCGTFALVRVTDDGPKLLEELNFAALESKYDFVPIKYKLKLK